VNAAFGEGLGVRVLGLILAFAIDDNRLRALTFGEKEEFIDAVADLFWQLHELESLRRLEKNNLVAFICLTLRDNVLGTVSCS